MKTQVMLAWINSAWRTAIVLEGKKWAHAICIDAPIMRRKYRLGDVRRKWKPSEYPLKKAARYMLGAGKRLGISAGAKRLLRKLR